MELQRRHVKLEQPHVLHDQRIDARIVKLPRQLARLFDLGVVEDGVEGNEDLCVKAMRKLDKPRNVRNRIRRPGTRTESRPADIHGIGPMLDGLDADIGIPCRRKEF